MIVGVDLGVRRIAVAAPAIGYLSDYHLPPKLPLSQCGPLMGLWLSKVIPANSQLWVERPLVFRNVRTAISQAIVLGAVIAPFARTVTLFENKEWKKAIVGDGNASKEQVGQWLQAAEPELARLCLVHGKLDEDRVDATCIGLYGLRMGGESRLPWSTGKRLLRP